MRLRGAWRRVRPLLALLLIGGALTSAAPALASDCGYESTRVEPIPNDPLVHAYAEFTTRDCPDGRSYNLVLQDPEGRTDVQWYDDERGSGIEVFRPPRFVSWLDSERGCQMVIYVFGANEMECVLGAPPAPPSR